MMRLRQLIPAIRASAAAAEQVRTLPRSSACRRTHGSACFELSFRTSHNRAKFRRSRRGTPLAHILEYPKEQT